MPNWAIALIIVGAVLALTTIITFLCSYVKAGPDQAIMISGSVRRRSLSAKPDSESPSSKDWTSFP